MTTRQFQRKPLAGAVGGAIGTAMLSEAMRMNDEALANGKATPIAALAVGASGVVALLGTLGVMGVPFSRNRSARRLALEDARANNLLGGWNSPPAYDLHNAGGDALRNVGRLAVEEGQRALGFLESEFGVHLSSREVYERAVDVMKSVAKRDTALSLGL